MKPAAGAHHIPTEIRLLRDERVLVVTFADGPTFRFPAELLRVESPSAEVQGHGGDKHVVPGRRDVAMIDLEPIGSYAVRIRFDDGHDSGLYSWDYLRQLGDNQQEIWDAYLAELERRGLSREP